MARARAALRRRIYTTSSICLASASTSTSTVRARGAAKGSAEAAKTRRREQLEREMCECHARDRWAAGSWSEEGSSRLLSSCECVAALFVWRMASEAGGGRW
jgi:hypothetical protein